MIPVSNELNRGDWQSAGRVAVEFLLVYPRLNGLLTSIAWMARERVLREHRAPDGERERLPRTSWRRPIDAVCDEAASTARDVRRCGNVIALAARALRHTRGPRACAIGRDDLPERRSVAGEHRGDRRQHADGDQHGEHRCDEADEVRAGWKLAWAVHRCLLAGDSIPRRGAALRGRTSHEQ